MTFKIFFQLIRIRETLFALPLVYLATILTLRFTHLSITLLQILLFLLVTFFAKASAMSFNRYFDRKIDALNPRTKHRLLPSGKVSSNEVLAFAIGSLFCFIFTCYFFHAICFQMSFGIAFLIATYPLFKRFSYLCHFVVGWIEFFIPIMVSIALTGHIVYPAFILALAIFFFISGIDLIYATQDMNVDRQDPVYSLAKILGMKGSLGVAFCLHLLFASCLLFSFILFEVGLIGFVGAGLALFLVFSQYYLLSKDLSLLPTTFFWCNSMSSVILFVFVSMDFLWLV